MGTFIKRGKAAVNELKNVEKKQAEDAAKRDNLYAQRFWMKEDTEKQITFLTGEMDEEGLLDAPSIYEHQVNRNGSWRNWYACVGHDDICPICEDAEFQKSFTGFFVVIDHTENEFKGKVYKDQVRLLGAKRDSLKKFQKYAKKRKGLAGCTFTVERTSKNEPNIGNEYEFEEKTPIAKILKKYKIDPETLDLEKLLVGNYQEAAQLRDLGFGSSIMGDESDDDDDDENYGSDM